MVCRKVIRKTEAYCGIVRADFEATEGRHHQRQTLLLGERVWRGPKLDNAEGARERENTKEYYMPAGFKARKSGPIVPMAPLVWSKGFSGGEKRALSVAGT